MNEFTLSYGILWILVLTLGWDRLRQDQNRGVQSNPSKLQGTDLGLPRSATFPMEETVSVEGTNYRIISGEGTVTVVIMLSTMCSVCRALASTLPDVIASHSEVKIFVLVAGEIRDVRQFASQAGIPLRLVGVTTIVEMRNIFGLTYYPFAYVLSDAGEILAKALLPVADHLIALINSNSSRR